MTGHFVEELIHRFEVEQQKNDRSGIYALTQRMMAYNSRSLCLISCLRLNSGASSKS